MFVVMNVKNVIQVTVNALTQRAETLLNVAADVNCDRRNERLNLRLH